MPKVVPEYKEEAKSKIVEAARIVFAKKGYHDATMDDVAKEVGVSKGALYSYFKSKEDILKEIYSAKSPNTQDHYQYSVRKT